MKKYLITIPWSKDQKKGDVFAVKRLNPALRYHVTEMVEQQEKPDPKRYKAKAKPEKESK